MSGRTFGAATPLHEILEDAWDAQLFRGPKALATMLGWTSYHTLRSKGSKSGYPDRTLVRDRVIFVELKREARTATPVADAQREWLDRLTQAGAECYLWRPSDLDEISRILSKRWTLLRATGTKPPLLAVEGPGPYFVDEWTPQSIWIPGLGRADTVEQQTLEKGAAA